jgi:GTPase involved in cell partitioning and DNA repair
LQSYSEALIKKPYLLVLTKKDKWEEDHAAQAGKFFKESFITISSLDGSGLQELKWKIWEQLEKIVQQEL